MGWARFFLKIDDELLQQDPGLNQTLISSGTSISQFFTQDKWERHRSISRYIRHLQTLFTSMVFVRTLEPIVCVTVVAMALTFWNVHWPQYALSISPIPHTLLGTVLGLLLVFRTNSSYARFDEGRRLTGAMVTNLRDVVRYCSVWVAANNRARAEKIAKLAVAFAYCVKSHTRRGRTRDDADDPTRFEDDPSEAVSRLADQADREKLLSARHKPLRALMLLSAHLKASFEEEEIPWHLHQECEQRLTDLGRSLGGCERLLSTPIPLSYTRHTSRTLALWLLFLPLALWSSMGPCVVPAMFVITYLLLGIDEIGIQVRPSAGAGDTAPAPVRRATDRCVSFGFPSPPSTRASDRGALLHAAAPAAVRGLRARGRGDYGGGRRGGGMTRRRGSSLPVVAGAQSPSP